MEKLTEILATAGLAAGDVSELLGVPVAVAAKYVEGLLRPSTRELNVLKGVALASVANQRTGASDGFDVSKRKKEQGLSGRSLEPTTVKEANSSMRRTKKTGSTLSTLELCAGGGGAALGLEQAGFEPLALLDIDPHACATLRRNRPYWNVIQADMRRFDASYWRGADLLSGGLPCPPFSIAGKQLGADDERDMFPSMLRIVDEVQPRAVLIENVRGILTSRFDPFRAKIDKALDDLGFETYWTGFNATDFGVPQSRFRAFLIALRRGETKPLRWPIPMANTARTVAEAIGDVMGSRGWAQLPRWIKQANSPAPTIVGGSHKHGGPDLGPTRARREWAELGVDGLGLADAPPPRDFEGLPRLTIPMVARLQTFPDDWTFAGSKTHAYRQVGNALPVQLAAAMAKAVKQCLS